MPARLEILNCNNDWKASMDSNRAGQIVPDFNLGTAPSAVFEHVTHEICSGFESYDRGEDSNYSDVMGVITVEDVNGKKHRMVACAAKCKWRVRLGTEREKLLKNAAKTHLASLHGTTS